MQRLAWIGVIGVMVGMACSGDAAQAASGGGVWRWLGLGWGDGYHTAPAPTYYVAPSSGTATLFPLAGRPVPAPRLDFTPRVMPTTAPPRTVLKSPLLPSASARPELPERTR